MYSLFNPNHLHGSQAQFLALKKSIISYPWQTLELEAYLSHPSLCIDTDSVSAVYISESFPMTCIEIISTTTTQGHKHALFDEVD